MFFLFDYQSEPYKTNKINCSLALRNFKLYSHLWLGSLTVKHLGCVEQKEILHQHRSTFSTLYIVGKVKVDIHTLCAYFDIYWGMDL